VLRSLFKVATPEEHNQRRRENGKRSRGPKTAEGREATDLSKVTHGVRFERPIIPGQERQQEWGAHHDAFISSLAPEGSVEHMLTYRIALNYWRLGRLTKAEVAAVSWEIKEGLLFSDDASERNLLPEAKTLDRLLDYERHLCGQLRRDFDRLERFQSLRIGRPVAPPIAVDVNVSSSPEPELG
jgi:hypothetical protein